MSPLFVNFYKKINISGRGRGYGYRSYGKLNVFSVQTFLNFDSSWGNLPLLISYLLHKISNILMYPKKIIDNLPSKKNAAFDIL